MVVKVVTDSISDLPKEVAEELGITVVPLYIQLGGKSYRDNIDITSDEIFRRLAEKSVKTVFPTTSAGPPGNFVEAYTKLLAEGAEGIVSVHASSKLSAIYKAALQAKEIMGKESSKIEVIDSSVGVMMLGFLAMTAAKLARQKKGLAEIVQAVGKDISHTHLLGIPDTLEYLYRGGRLPKPLYLIAQNAMRAFNLRACLTLRNGEISYYGTRFIRPVSKTNHLLKFIRSFPNIEAVAMEYSADASGETARIVKTIKQEIEPQVPSFYICPLSSVICVHAGPGTLVVSVKTKNRIR